VEPPGHPSQPHLVLNFVKELTRAGGPIRILNVVDEFTRVSLGSHVARSIGARYVVRHLERLFESTAVPN
jgi:hypothetical protein